MILETLTAVSLHCSVAESRWPETDGPPVRALVYADYDSRYGYLKIDHPKASGEIETHSLLVTDQRIQFLDGRFSLINIEDLTIDRVTGAFTMTVFSPFSDGGRTTFRGTCAPGEPITLPGRPAPRF